MKTTGFVGSETFGRKFIIYTAGYINVESLKIIFVKTSNATILQYYMERKIIVVYRFKFVYAAAEP